MTDSIDGSGKIPSQQPTVPQAPEKPAGTLGDKTVTPHDLDENLLEGQEITRHTTALTDRSVVVTEPASEDNIELIQNLIRTKQWDGVRSALDRHVTTLAHFDQLAAKVPDKLPLEGMQVITNRYGVLAAERITSNLADLEGTPGEQLDCLNLYFVQPHSPQNAVRTVVRAIVNDFMQNSGFDNNLKQSLTDQMETSVFHQLHRHAEALGIQVIAEGNPDLIKQVIQQSNQRKIEIGA